MERKRKHGDIFIQKAMAMRSHGYVLHHIDPTWKVKDIKRYRQYNVEDLVMVTYAEHTKLHRELEPEKFDMNGDRNPMFGRHHTSKAKAKQGMSCKDKHHYYNAVTCEQRMFVEAPSKEWKLGMPFYSNDRSKKASNQQRDNNGKFSKQPILYDQTGSKNGMYMKDSYKGKSDKELLSIREKKKRTYYAKSQEERDIINGRRAGCPIICITTR